jgi:hypothetical protein
MYEFLWVFLIGDGFRKKISVWIHRNFSLDIREDPSYPIYKSFRIFLFGHEDKPLIAFELEGVIHEKDKLKIIRPFGESKGVSMKPSLLMKYGFNDGKKVRQHFIQITKCNFLKQDSPIIIICREQDEIGG